MARGPRKSRIYYGRPRQRGSYYATLARRILLWEARYLIRHLLQLGAGMVVITAAALLSKGTIPWPNFATNSPSPVQTSTTTDVVGRASVIDGDTLDIRGKRIRIFGVDAPESAQPCLIQGKPWRCGQQAASALADYIGQQTVACLEQDRDSYGRVVVFDPGI